MCSTSQRDRPMVNALTLLKNTRNPFSLKLERDNLLIVNKNGKIYITIELHNVIDVNPFPEIEFAFEIKEEIQVTFFHSFST